jgi:hypothetical protein
VNSTDRLARDGFSPDEIANMAGPTFEAQPIPLRWGLDDVMYGDDDTTTVMLSGPDGEPYWLELDPKRTAALRQNLAGPDGEPETQQPDRRRLSPNEYSAAWHAVEGAAGEPGADPATVLHAVLRALGIATPAP